MLNVNRLLLETVQPNGRCGRILGVAAFLLLVSLALWWA